MFKGDWRQICYISKRVGFRYKYPCEKFQLQQETTHHIDPGFGDTRLKKSENIENSVYIIQNGDCDSNIDTYDILYLLAYFNA